MTLYHYVRTKDDLRALMDDAMMAEILVPSGELPDDWRAALTELARRSWGGVPPPPVGAHGARVGRGGRPERHAPLRAVARGGRGHRARRDRPARGFEQRVGTSSMPPGEYPHVFELAAGGEPREVFGRIMAAIFDEQRFERGLERLLDGIAPDVQRRTARGSRAAS